MVFDTFLGGYLFGPGGKSAGLSFDFDKKSSRALIFYRLISLVLGRFTYDLPPSVDSRYMELTLLSGGAGFDLVGGEPHNFSALISGGYNQYGYPESVQLIDYMGRSYGRIIPDFPGNEIIADGVVIYDSKYDLPPIYRINWYANRLWRIQVSIATAIQNLRMGVIYEANGPSQARAIERAIKALDDGKPFLIDYGKEAALAEPPRITRNLDSGEGLKTLTELYDKTFCDFLTEFGINANGTINKLSGVSDSELEQNEEATEIALNAALKQRREGMAKCERMFGGTWSVDRAFTNREETDTIREREEAEKYDEL